MITASLVKELREKTGAGMMDCKKALTECDGDISKAIDWLREKGIAKAAKKSGRIAAEGLSRVAVEGNVGVIFEVNSETDFVAKNDQFLALLDTIQQVLIEKRPADLAAALACDSGQGTLEEVITNATATIGEKITLRRFAVVEKNDDEFFGAYMHMGGKISVLAKLSGQEDASVAKNIAMQIASMSPAYITRDEIPADVVEHERGVQMNIMKEDPKMAGKSEAENKCVADFFNFLSDPKIQAENHMRTGYLPVTMRAFEIAKESGYYEKNPGADVAVKQMLKTTDKSRGIRLGYLPNIRTIVDEEFEKVWSGQQDAKAAIDAVMRRGNEQLTRFERIAR